MLAGRISSLAASDKFFTTDAHSPKNILLGWIKLDAFTIWASNLVLELNTSPDSVAKRVITGAEDPAVVFAKPDESSSALWVEPLSTLWPNGGVNEDLVDAVQFDPIGLSADFPRWPLLQTLDPEGQWYKVAFAASTKQQELTESAIMVLKRDLGRAMQDLLQVDIVFVVVRIPAMMTIDSGRT